MGSKKNERSYLNSEVVQGVCFISFSIILFVQSRNLGFDSGLVPRMMLVLLSILGIALILKSIRLFNPKPSGSTWPREIILRSIVVVIAVLAFWGGIQYVGFYVSTFFLFLFFYFFFDPRLNLKNILIGLSYSLVSTILFYYIFYILMRVITPSGVLI